MAGIDIDLFICFVVVSSIFYHFGYTLSFSRVIIDMVNMYRAIANGPVGPDMAGPIIEPAIFFFLKFFIIFFWPE